MKKFTGLFSNLPLFSKIKDKELILKCALAESSAFGRSLSKAKKSIFPRDRMAPDKYLEYIPLTWTACRALEPSNNISGAILEEMMIVSMLNYQVDEYMETVIDESFGHNVQIIRALVQRLCLPIGTWSLRPYKTNGTVLYEDQHRKPPQTFAQDKPLLNDDEKVREVEEVLSAYINRFLYHPRVQSAPELVQEQLQQELNKFFQAHLTQIEDNRMLSSGVPKCTRSLTQQQSSQDAQVYSLRYPKSFFEWVCSTGADHTSCPFSFIYFCCLIDSQLITKSAKQNYLARDLGRRLASACRMYNDCGSLARDRAEYNLNSLDFKEFTLSSLDASGSIEEVTKKQDLLWLADYEFEGVRRAMEKLEKEGIDDRTMTALRLFVNVTDLYGQIYVARDIAVRLK